MTTRRLALSLSLVLSACGDDSAAMDAATEDIPRADVASEDVPAVDADSSVDAEMDTSMMIDVGVDSGIRDPGTEGDGDHELEPPYMRAPELNVPDDVTRGNVYRFSMDSTDSEIYPGVSGDYTRNLWVYVPTTYVNGEAAPLMVVQDGGGYVDRLTAALDTMIAAGELPPIVAVFVNPGPGDGRGSQRGLEYDTVSDA